MKAALQYHQSNAQSTGAPLGEQRESIDLAKSAARPGEVPIRAESRMVSEVASESSLGRIDVHSWYDGVLVVARRSRSQFEARVVAVIVRM